MTAQPPDLAAEVESIRRLVEFSDGAANTRSLEILLLHVAALSRDLANREAERDRCQEAWDRDQPELSRLRAENERLTKDLAHWKDCHGVTADSLAAAESELAALRRPVNHAPRIEALRKELTSCWEYDWRTDGMRVLFDELDLLSRAKQEAESKLLSECAAVRSLEAQRVSSCETIVKLEAELAALRRPVNHAPRTFTMNGRQVKHLLDLIDGEDATEVSLEWFNKARPDGNSADGEMMPPGLYAWFADCPEEGQMLLPESFAAGSGDGVAGD